MSSLQSVSSLSSSSRTSSFSSSSSDNDTSNGNPMDDINLLNNYLLGMVFNNGTFYSGELDGDELESDELDGDTNSYCSDNTELLLGTDDEFNPDELNPYVLYGFLDDEYNKYPKYEIVYNGTTKTKKIGNKIVKIEDGSDITIYMDHNKNEDVLKFTDLTSNKDFLLCVGNLKLDYEDQELDESLLNSRVYNFSVTNANIRLIYHSKKIITIIFKDGVPNVKPEGYIYSLTIEGDAYVDLSKLIYIKSLNIVENSIIKTFLVTSVVESKIVFYNSSIEYITLGELSDTLCVRVSNCSLKEIKTDFSKVQSTLHELHISGSENVNINVKSIDKLYIKRNCNNTYIRCDYVDYLYHNESIVHIDSEFRKLRSEGNDEGSLLFVREVYSKPEEVSIGYTNDVINSFLPSFTKEDVIINKYIRIE